MTLYQHISDALCHNSISYHMKCYIFNIRYHELEVNPSALLCLNNSCHDFNVCVCLSSETVINVRQIEVQQHSYYILLSVLMRTIRSLVKLCLGEWAAGKLKLQFCASMSYLSTRQFVIINEQSAVMSGTYRHDFERCQSFTFMQWTRMMVRNSIHVHHKY